MAFRFPLVLALLALSADARAQLSADPAPESYTHVALDVGLSALASPSAPLAAPDSVSDAPDAVAPEVVGPGLLAARVDEPAPVEDIVQMRMPHAPVRMELAQTRRRVVLLPGVSTRDLELADAPDPLTVGHVTFSRAVVVVSEGGRREVRFVDGDAPALDLGQVAGCDGAALDGALGLRGVRATPLRLGMRGAAVVAAQHLLCAAGHAIAADGVFDGRMDSAVRAFQRDYNAQGLGPALRVDGALGPKTRKALDAVIAVRSAG